MGCETRQSLFVNGFDLLDALQHRLGFKNAQTGICRRASQRIPRVRVTMEECLRSIRIMEGAVNLFATYRGGERKKAASQTFGQTHDVGYDVGQFTGEHGSCSAEPGKHFVRD